MKNPNRPEYLEFDGYVQSFDTTQNTGTMIMSFYFEYINETYCAFFLANPRYDNSISLRLDNTNTLYINSSLHILFNKIDSIYTFYGMLKGK